MARPKNPDILRIQVSMSKQMKDYYTNYAKEIGNSVSGVISMILKMYMDGMSVASQQDKLKELLLAVQKQSKDNKK